MLGRKSAGSIELSFPATQILPFLLQFTSAFRCDKQAGSFQSFFHWHSNMALGLSSLWLTPDSVLF